MKFMPVCKGKIPILLTLAAVSFLSGCGNFWKAPSSSGGGSTATTTTLTASTSTPVAGTSITLTATVSPTAATGTVTFFDGTTSLGTGSLASGTATLAATFTTTGAHSLTATYGGSSTYASSTSNAVTVTVSASSTAIAFPSGTTTTLSISTSTPVAGGKITLRADVSPSSAAGTVTFYDGTVVLGMATVNAGTAALSISFGAAGPHSITAIYSGSTGYTTSTSRAESITVGSPSASSNCCRRDDAKSLSASARASADSQYGDDGFARGRGRKRHHKSTDA